MIQIITFSVLIIITLLMIAYRKEIFEKDKDYFYQIIKGLTLAYLILSYINIFLPDGLSVRVYPDQTLYQDLGNRWFSILRWASDTSFILLPITIFYHKKKFENCAITVLPVLLLLSIIFSAKYISFYTDLSGEGIRNIRFFSLDLKDFFINENFRSIYLIVLFLLEGTVLSYLLIRKILSIKEQKNNKKYEPLNKQEVLTTMLLFVFLLLAVTPIYLPSYLLGGYKLEEDGWAYVFKMGSLTHIVWLLFIPFETIVLYKVFKRFNKDDQYILVLSLAIALFYQFSGIYTCFGEIITQRYPFQLCNLASLLMLPTVLTKNKTLSVFALTTNAVGVIIALILCDSAKAGVNYIMNVHYIVEHTKVFMIPLLCYNLGIFEKLTKDDFKIVIKGFSYYFIFVFILGGIFTGIYDTTGNDYFYCNYLFMFNKEVSCSIVPFAAPLFDCKIVLFHFFTISLIQVVIYIVFMALSIGYFKLFLWIDKMVREKREMNKTTKNTRKNNTKFDFAL